MAVLSSIFLSVDAAEVVAGKKPGGLVLHVEGNEVLYGGVIGNDYGIDRSFTYINGSPALLVLSKDSFYFTLIIEERKILVDCVYLDKRNNYNGARMMSGMCGINIPLRKTYEEIAQGFSTTWRNSIYSFDTSAVLENPAGRDFSLGKIGKVEIFDRYPSASSLENSSPQKIIKSDSGCFNFGEVVGFLVFLNKNNPSLQYLDVMRSEDPIKIQRFKEQDLIGLAVGRCN